MTLLANDKQALMDAGNYEVFNRDVMRKVFPRIIADFKALRPKAKVGDIIPFYFALLAYTDGNATTADGLQSFRFGAAFPTQDRIAEMTGINKKRHKLLTEILRENGLLLRVEDLYEGTRHYKWYFPSWTPKVTAEGYVVDENGQRIVPNMERLLTLL